MIGSIVQIIISMIFVCLLAIIGYSIYNAETLDALNNYNTVRKTTKIFDGVLDFYERKDTSFNTIDKLSGSYVDLSPSMNQNGGAEYSYNFWLRYDPDKISSNENICLLLRGNKQRINYKSEGSHHCLVQNGGNKYIITKNPLIRMVSETNSRYIVVEYNNITNPDSYKDNGEDTGNCNGGLFDKNKQGLGVYSLSDDIYKKKWFMITVVLQEISPDNNILNKYKTSCKMYLNGENMLDRIVESSEYNSAVMKHNLGKLYVAPTDIFQETHNNGVTGNEGVMMANLSYNNYALTPLEIKDLYKAGFTKGAAKI